MYVHRFMTHVRAYVCIYIYIYRNIHTSPGLKFRRTWLHHLAEDAEYREVHLRGLASGGINPPK